MKKFQDTMKDIGAHVHMSAQEKDAMREKVFEYMEYKPVVRKGVSTTKTYFFFGQLNTAFAVLLLLVVSGAGVSFTVPNAVPGDLLFGVKTAGEEIKMATMSSEKERALYSVERMYTRFAEHTKLVESGRGANMAYVEEGILKAEEELDTLSKTDPVQAQAIRVAFAIGKEVREEGTLAFSGADFSMDSEPQAASLAMEAPEMMFVDNTQTAVSAGSKMMARTVVQESAISTVEVLPKAPKSTLTLEVLEALIDIMESRIEKLVNIDTFTQERVVELQQQLGIAMKEGDVVYAERLVYDILYIIERAAAGLDIMFPIEEESVEEFDPSTIEVRELPNN
ncbi:MAG: hypothetical protein CMI56_02775 [Parcubacteria group bacterium]|mgnify:CR=1 FL=1|nr:hypothetical protein [Parcubacteria group bacterium]|tara:strand:+ start:541 stop:1554 length:1014 start_codon:yes stop_codon:yes gene_type:complete